MKGNDRWKTVGRNLLSICILLGSRILLYGAELPKTQLSRVLDLSLDLKGVVQLVRKPDFNLPSFQKFLLLDGSIAGITILEKNPTNFTAELELVQGEWIGTEEVKLYRAYVYAQGPSFASLLTSSIKANDYVLVIGSIEDIYTDDAGTRYPVILAHSIRKLH
ncbi:MAG: hypothetical protein N2442_03520 [Spirochaetes bacterium]|nr:hypothetical protein [Spirochaetota bacterium]